MQNRVVSLLLVFFMFVPTVMSQEAESLFEKQVFVSSGDNKSLNYRLLKPAKQEEGETYPLVLFLHGAGERGSDNEKQLLHGVTEFAKEPLRTDHPAFVLAPQCPAEEYWVNADWSKEKLEQPEKIALPLRLAMEALRETMAKYPVDKERIYITGLSMGGFGTWDLIARYPDVFAAAVPVCGGGDVKTAQTIKDIPIWNFHGAEDPVVPVKLSRDIYHALSNVNGNIIYTEIPGMGHNSWDVAYHEPKVYRWIFAQER